MSEAYSIPPFPSDIDHDAFGHWLSGFTDGEGSFFLRLVKDRHGKKPPQPYATFRIALRADDKPILLLIQSFFGCGLMARGDNIRTKIANAKPVSIYHIGRTEQLAKIIVPHFEKYPLRAKKRNDFLIWKQGVEMLFAVMQRRYTWRPGKAANRHGGTYPKWTIAEREHFETLMTTLRQQRTFQAYHTELPQPPIQNQERMLFDDLDD